MGSPARRQINPIMRCWDQPHYGYAGTDDGRGTGQRLDTKRLTLMSGCFRKRLPWHVDSNVRSKLIHELDHSFDGQVGVTCVVDPHESITCLRVGGDGHLG